MPGGSRRSPPTGTSSPTSGATSAATSSRSTSRSGSPRPRRRTTTSGSRRRLASSSRTRWARCSSTPATTWRSPRVESRSSNSSASTSATPGRDDMRTLNRWTLLGLACLGLGALAQAPAPAPAPATAPQPAAAPAAPGPTQDAAASLLKVYVFPANNQTPDQQSKDSNDCYAWAKQQTGVDPTNPTVPQKADTSQTGQGAAVKGAAKGAAIGAIAGDTGKGAAIGAAAGGMGGASAKRQGKKQAEAQAQQQQQAAVNQQIDAFKKAYTACMEGKKYTVK